MNPQIRDDNILDGLSDLQMCEPLKHEILLSLYKEAQTDMKMIRAIKKERYMGTVTFGMIMYNLMDLFGEDMVSKEDHGGRTLYSLSPRFKALCKKAYGL